MKKQMGMTVLICGSKAEGARYKKKYSGLLNDARVFTAAPRSFVGMEGMRISRVFVCHGSDRWSHPSYEVAVRGLHFNHGSDSLHADPEPIVLRIW